MPAGRRSSAWRVRPLTRDDLHRLFEEQRDPLYRFLRRLTGDPGSADDLLQDAFLLLWQKRARYDVLEHPAAFLRAVSFRLYLSGRRRALRRRSLAPSAPPEPTAPSGDDQVAADEERTHRLARVHAELDRLPEEMREAFDLYRLRGLSIHEIAQFTGAPAKTGETRVRRATVALARALGPVLDVHERCACDE